MKYDGSFIKTEKILSALGLKGNPSGNNLYTNCPVHNDKTPSFSINVENGRWICFARCGGGNLLSLVKQVLGCSELEAHHWLIEQSESDSNYVYSLLKNDEKKNDLPVEVIDEDEIKYGILPDWFADRGFTIDDIIMWNLGYEYQTGALIIPCGNGFIRRFPPGNFKRYEYSTGFNRKFELFGLDRLLQNYETLESLVVTEGSLDTMWCVKYGFDSVAILGSYMSEHHFKKISQLNPEKVVLAFDNDDAGKKATRQAAQQNRGRLNLYYLQLPDGYNDVQEVSGPILQKLLTKIQPIQKLQLQQSGPFRRED